MWTHSTTWAISTTRDWAHRGVRPRPLIITSWRLRLGKPAREIFWQGPSIGFDFGGNASKAFVLIYNLPMAEDIFQRFPGVDGSFYLVAGVGVNNQTDDGTTLAPIRTGVGLRAGANLGYLHYTSEAS